MPFAVSQEFLQPVGRRDEQIAQRAGSVGHLQLEAGREYAQRHQTTLNGLIRRLLEQTVLNTSGQWVDECFALMDKTQATSGGARWTREELYRG